VCFSGCKYIFINFNTQSMLIQQTNEVKEIGIVLKL
jgi:hypothetical protein